MRDYAYYKKALCAQPLPLAYLDLDLLNENIQQVTARSGDKRIRLAAKSLRSVSVLRHILQAGACFQGIMCYTAREALYLTSQGFTDLLVGYPTWQSEDIAAVAQTVREGGQIVLMIDSVEHVTHIEEIAARQDAIVPVCIDIDMSIDFPGLHFGVWRSPLRTPEQVRPVLECLEKSPHVQLDGIMGYEAQIAGLGDLVPGQRAKSAVVRALKRRSIDRIASRRAAVVTLIEQGGHKLRFVNGGGTGSIETTCAESAVTEITVGSGFYSPTLFDNYRNFRYQPAAGFVLEIVRQPGPGLYTCLGGGYTASGAVGLDKQVRPYLPEGAVLTSLEGAGEVQTPVRYTGPVSLSLGDPLFMRHAKAGELCEHFTHLLLISDGAVIDKVTTYRGDGHCFL